MYRPDARVTAVINEIAKWVAGQEAPIRLLTNAACLVGNQMHCNACSIYLYDPQAKRLILGGTVGLRQECVGRIQMSLDEGLTGLAARERRPVVVPTHASAHPDFRYFPEAGEDLYESFLGVPLISRGAVVGVLVLQTFESADFSNEDIHRMITTGRELAPLIAAIRIRTLDELACLAQETAGV